MEVHPYRMWMVLISITMIIRECTPAPNSQEETSGHAKPKLLYIMMDGFRWDYVDLQATNDLPGFTKFLRSGVRANWTNPLFPSLSYPTWTTLVTGQYAETHGIVGNYFYDSETKEEFSLFDADATGKKKWWTSEPIWTTAEKGGLKTAQYLWARCDVPIDNVTTHFCKPFTKIPGKDIFQENIMSALVKLSNGYDFVQVYTEHADHSGHNYGPDSEEVLQAVRDLDDVVKVLMEELEIRELSDIVNIVIVSDHGMAYTAPGAITRYDIDNYIDPSMVEHIADKGAIMSIKVLPGHIDKVYEDASKIPGVSVYRKDEIPERYHFKKGKYVQDILLVASEETFLMASKTDKQLPKRDDSFVYYGAHGYDPDYEKMKGIFFAKGPAFQKGKKISPIHVVDIYQVLTHILGLTPNPHNGTWDAVQMAFDPSYLQTSSSSLYRPSASLVILLGIFLHMIWQY